MKDMQNIYQKLGLRPKFRIQCKARTPASAGDQHWKELKESHCYK